MKKRISIYIDSGVWESAKDVAWGRRISASKYLEDLIIEDRSVKKDIPEIKSVVTKPAKKAVRSDDEVLAEAQAKLMVKDKITKFREAQDAARKKSGIAVPNFFNPQPKGK